ncbi:t-SNARE [Hyaloraphidium curvatum]|nr:t-SNARE [Hyaloraphidium curvatum]
MRDRTRELTGPPKEEEELDKESPPPSTKSTKPWFGFNIMGDKSEDDLEAGTAQPGASTDMAKLFEDIATARDGLATLKRAIDSVDPLHSRTLNATSESEIDELSTEMENLMNRISVTANQVRLILKKIDSETKAAAKVEKDSTNQRVRQTQQAAITKKFLEYMTQYKEVEEKYQDKYKNRLRKEVLVVRPNATEEEVAEALQQGTASIFAQQTLKGSRQTDDARMALHSIQARHNDILRIEKTVIELQQLFMDMAVLVAAQDDAIIEIGQNVQKTVEYTEKGVDELRKARKKQKKSRKMMCLVVLCLIVVLVITGVIVLVVLKR